MNKLSNWCQSCFKKHEDWMIAIIGIGFSMTMITLVWTRINPQRIEFFIFSVMVMISPILIGTYPHRKEIIKAFTKQWTVYIPLGILIMGLLSIPYPTALFLINSFFWPELLDDAVISTVTSISMIIVGFVWICIGEYVYQKKNAIVFPNYL